MEDENNDRLFYVANTTRSRWHHAALSLFQQKNRVIVTNVRPVRKLFIYYIFFCLTGMDSDDDDEDHDKVDDYHYH